MSAADLVELAKQRKNRRSLLPSKHNCCCFSLRSAYREQAGAGGVNGQWQGKASEELGCLINALKNLSCRRCLWRAMGHCTGGSWKWEWKNKRGGNTRKETTSGDTRECVRQAGSQAVQQVAKSRGIRSPGWREEQTETRERQVERKREGNGCREFHPLVGPVISRSVPLMKL